jgi:hypothetical protein
MAVKKSFNASRPPADAPMPTTCTFERSRSMVPNLEETTIFLVPERQIDPEIIRIILCCNHHLDLEASSMAAAFTLVKAMRSPP